MTTFLNVFSSDLISQRLALLMGIKIYFYGNGDKKGICVASLSQPIMCLKLFSESLL